MEELKCDAEAKASVFTSNRKMIEDVADDYESYLTVDSSSEIKIFEENIEGLLTRLDEYCGLVDLIRSDTSLNLIKTLPEIEAKTSEMQLVFDRVDQLEALVAVVRNNVNNMEEEVNRAEAELGSLSTIKKMFTNISLPFSKKPVPKPKPESKVLFNRPDVYRTEHYFPAEAGEVPVGAKQSRAKQTEEQSSPSNNEGASKGEEASQPKETID